ncbi:WD40 repeat domain-containing protein [Leptolyngbya sp. 7M]|uniref:WD40 repeat domain-containing protein n=1 Tax=Leptolyngbya sp. 7M TaxID=2812896 RepID=UPI001CEDCC33|nr:hypothetical protein [Leptolyngbya sp. 7M]
MQPVRTLQAHNSWIRALQFSPDGQSLLSGGSDYTIKLWDISSGQVLKTWIGYSNWIWSVDVSRDGAKMISGGGDRTVRVWDLATGDCLQSLGHTTWVLAVACFDSFRAPAVADQLEPDAPRYGTESVSARSV